jgi:beta-glucosidase
VIFGDFAPQGRLPVSFPQASGQQPFHYDRRSTGRPQVDAATAFKARYDEVANAPLYPFGYGLTFSRVDYGPTQVSGPKFSRDGVLKVSALLRNVGERAAHEVAQLYIHQRVAAITQPLRRLRAIRHVDLAPGAEALVEFTLRAGDLASIHPDLSDRADAGVFDVWVAPSAEAGEKASFTLA